MNLSISDIGTYASNAGFSGADLVTAVAIAMAESSGNPDAVGDANIGNGSFGLWQISSKYHPEYGPDFSILFDPQTNADAAYAIYSAAGDSFSPWSTYNSGAYNTYLSAVGAAIATLGSTGTLILVALIVYGITKI